MLRCDGGGARAADMLVAFLSLGYFYLFYSYIIFRLIMRRVYFLLIFGLVLVAFSSCSRYFLVDSEGILEWDGTMRKLNMIWNHKQSQPVVIRDTLWVAPIASSDSVK